ncbi:hypothetical protein C9374_012289 [Naegleria lovaniensis]|uniref:Enoyl reductase (ER) domain-containing protein n=1 Tax=Naegleria lovaniensis TaxID=51637 RepID=A0AA88GD81_NAELO|nr:uncharacterized protein C9374_012289 [Naegleria lovaniensis]KAG2373300.1 hypothetical protein C9374_012289 [Naegleria lovaniensis]
MTENVPDHNGASSSSLPTSSSPTTMKAIFYESYGGPDVLQFSDKFKTPQLPSSSDHSQVVVRVLYTSINPLDFKIRNGFFRNILVGKTNFPVIPSTDLSGIVVQASPSSSFKVGDEVFGMNGHGGCLAEYNLVNEHSLALKPKELSHAEASTIPMVGLTAHQSLVEIGKVKENSTVLILGASGNVGSYCLQYAKNVLGAEVYAGCTTEKGVEMVKELKPEKTFMLKNDLKKDTSRVNSSNTPHTSAASVSKENEQVDKSDNHENSDKSSNVKEPIDDDDHTPFEYSVPNVDVIIDCIGDKQLRQRTWKLLKSRRAKYIQIGVANEEMTFWNLLKLGTFISWRKVISAVGLGPEFVFFRINSNNQTENLEKLASYHVSGKIKPNIATYFDEMNLENVKTAYSLAETRRTRGKILIQVSKWLPQYDQSRKYLMRFNKPAMYKFVNQ